VCLHFDQPTTGMGFSTCVEIQKGLYFGALRVSRFGMMNLYIDILTLILLDIYPEMGLLNHIIALLLTS
jgi:hypothetical protein